VERLVDRVDEAFARAPGEVDGGIAEDVTVYDVAEFEGKGKER